MKETDPKRAGLFFLCPIMTIFEAAASLMKKTSPYSPPHAEPLAVCLGQILAQSYNPDNNTEYIDEEYGGLI